MNTTSGRPPNGHLGAARHAQPHHPAATLDASMSPMRASHGPAGHPAAGRPTSYPSTAFPSALAGPSASVDADADMLIRPFIVTGGRTEPLRDGLRMETLIDALPAALHAPLRFELRRIVEMCQVPRSVAEIATRLEVPLGVARVLVADLVTEGLVNYSYQESSELPIHVIERILAGVRAL